MGTAPFVIIHFFIIDINVSFYSTINEENMGIIEEINNLVEKAEQDGSLTGMLRTVISKYPEPKSSASSYYTVTQLINPIATYYSKKNPKIVDKPVLRRRLAQGRQLHNLVSYWFRNVPGFMDYESLIDGVWEEVDKVRGKIDYLINESILEFKTKDKNPVNNEEVFSFYPHDLEQLAFYSAMHTIKPKTNYLVFMENQKPYKLNAFKVEINNRAVIKDIMRSRIKLLDKAIEKEDTSSLGQCRYHKSDCKFIELKMCNCDKIAPIDISELKKSITINQDQDFTNMLETVRESTNIRDIFCLTTFDIIAPRKYYMETLSDISSDYQSDPTSEEYKACLWTSVDDLKKQFKIKLTQAEAEEIKQSEFDHRLRIGFRWIKYKRSGSKDRILPYILNVSTINERYKTQKPPAYRIAELGIACGLFHTNAGIIFLVYPNLNDYVVAFYVVFKNEKELSRIVKKTIDTIQSSEKAKNLLGFPECPNFFCPLKTTKAKCQFANQCVTAKFQFAYRCASEVIKGKSI